MEKEARKAARLTFQASKEAKHAGKYSVPGRAEQELEVTARSGVEAVLSAVEASSMQPLSSLLPFTEQQRLVPQMILSGVQ